MSGVDLEYEAMLAEAGVSDRRGYDGARLKQLINQKKASGEIGSGGAGLPAIATVPAIIRTVRELAAYKRWLNKTPDAVGYVGEIGWPKNGDKRWHDMAEAWYALADAYGLWATSWDSSSWWGSTYYTSIYESANGINGPLSVVNAGAAVLEKHGSKEGMLRGVTNSGLANIVSYQGRPYSAQDILDYGFDYYGENAASYAFLYARGVRLVRISFKWERLQPVLGGALFATELNRLKADVAAATAAGLKVIIAMQNFGGYTRTAAEGEKKISRGNSVVATPVTEAHFSNFWTRMVSEFTNPNTMFCLMIEPEGLGKVQNPLYNGFTSIANFEADLQGWIFNTPANAARSTVDKRSGVASAAVTQNWSTDTFSVLYKDLGGTVFTGKKVHFWVKIPANFTGATGRIDVNYNNYTTTVQGSSFNLTPGQWSLIEWDKDPELLRKGINVITVTVVANGSPNAVSAVYIDDGAVGDGPRNADDGSVAWEQISQTVVNDLRSAGFLRNIVVSTYRYSVMAEVNSIHPDGPWIKDPYNPTMARPPMVYETHHYWDTERSGNYALSFDQENTNALAQGYAP